MAAAARLLANGGQDRPVRAATQALGFSDQAHLIREVRAFSGQSPGRIGLGCERSDSTFNGEGASRFFDTVYVRASGPGCR